MARQINWPLVQATFPSAGTPTPITQVTNVAVATNPQLQKGYGDADRYPTTARVTREEPMMTVTTENESFRITFKPGVRVDLVEAVHADADAEDGDPDAGILYELSNAVVSGGNAGGAHGAFGNVPIEFHGVSPDGITSPLAISVYEAA